MKSIFSQQKRVFNATHSNAIISKLKNIKIFAQFLSLFAQSTWNFRYFERKDEPQRLLVSENIDFKKTGYLKD